MRIYIPFLLLVLGVCEAHNSQPKTIDEIIAAASDNVDVKVNEDGSILAEMDIRYTPQQWAAVHSADAHKGHVANRWVNSIIFFERDNVFNSAEWEVIERGMQEWEYYTCIRFRRRTTEPDYVRFVRGNGCSSFVGRIGGPQDVTLGQGCLVHSVIVHELGHVIGLFHEHRRPDRDNYVAINWDNVQDGLTDAFTKLGSDTVNTYGINYDYTSIMHYGQMALSRNGMPTILARQTSMQTIMGTAPTLRISDIRIVNLMYKCAEWCGPRSCPPGAMVNQYCSCWCGYTKIDMEPIYMCGLGGPDVPTTPLPTRYPPTRPVRTTPGRVTGPTCVKSCTSLSDGDYQSCTRCDTYISCVSGRTIANRPCPPGTSWDDRLKRCWASSSTCTPI